MTASRTSSCLWYDYNKWAKGNIWDKNRCWGLCLSSGSVCRTNTLMYSHSLLWAGEVCGFLSRWHPAYSPAIMQTSELRWRLHSRGPFGALCLMRDAVRRSQEQPPRSVSSVLGPLPVPPTCWPSPADCWSPCPHRRHLQDRQQHKGCYNWGTLYLYTMPHPGCLCCITKVTQVNWAKVISKCTKCSSSKTKQLGGKISRNIPGILLFTVFFNLWLVTWLLKCEDLLPFFPKNSNKCNISGWERQYSGKLTRLMIDLIIYPLAALLVLVVKKLFDFVFIICYWWALTPSPVLWETSLRQFCVGCNCTIMQPQACYFPL